MENEIAAWQLEMFGGPSPIVATLPPKVDPLPDPQFWSEAVREKMVGWTRYWDLRWTAVAVTTCPSR